jgi:hypothetical protein
MIKNVKLFSNFGRLADSEPFLLPDTLSLRFRHQGYDLSNAFITLKNGEKLSKIKFSNPFNVPKEFLFAGDLSLKIEMFLGGEVAKQWNILPIRIMETPTGLETFDLLNKIEKELKTIKDDYVPKEKYMLVVEKLNEVAEKQNVLAETVSAIKEN